MLPPPASIMAKAEEDILRDIKCLRLFATFFFMWDILGHAERVLPFLRHSYSGPKSAKLLPDAKFLKFSFLFGRTLQPWH